MSEDQIPKSESLASKAKSKKRSREDDGGRRKKKKTGYEQDDSLLDTELGVNSGIAFMDPQLMADHLAQRTTKFGTDLSPLELADLYISRKDYPYQGNQRSRFLIFYCSRLHTRHHIMARA